MARIRIGERLSLMLFTPFKTVYVSAITWITFALAAAFCVFVAIVDPKIGGPIITGVSGYIWWLSYGRSRGKKRRRPPPSTPPPTHPGSAGAGRPVGPVTPQTMVGKEAQEIPEQKEA